MKRFTAMLTVIALMVMTLPLTGCGEKRKDAVSWGQWLTMLDNVFGMETYTAETPYYNNITDTNPYFEAVQIAVEWNAVSPENELDTDKNISWREAILTLINVGNFTALDAEEDEKLQYALEHFDMEIRDYWLDRDIEADKAVLLLGIAQEQWANFKYDHVIEEITFQEGVKDFTQGEWYLGEYLILEDNVIAVPLEYAPELRQGDIYVLPPNLENLSVSAYKAETVYCDEDFLYIQNSYEEIELEDIVKELFIEETYMPTMENAVVYDGNGNVISVGSNVMPYTASGLSGEETGVVSDMVYRGNNLPSVGMANAKVSHEFNIDGCKVSLEYKADDIFNMKVSVETDNLLPSKEHGEPKRELKLSGSMEISKLEVTNNIDYGFFKLNSALLKIDYKTAGKIAVSYSSKPINKVVAPKWSNGNSHFWNALTREDLKLKDINAKGAKTIKLASVDVYSIGIVRVCLDINMKLSLDGSVSIEVTESGSKGLEYRNRNLRVINTSDKSMSITCKGKTEFTVGMGPALYAIGLKKQLIGAEIDLGVGASASVTAHLADTENHLLEECNESDISAEVCEAVGAMALYADVAVIDEIAKRQGGTYATEVDSAVQIHADICADVTGYFIVKLQLTDTSLAASLLDGKIKVSWEIFGEKNARFCNIHVENGEFVGMEWGNWTGNLCTKTYKPFDNVVEATASPKADEKTMENSDDTIARGELLITDQMNVRVGVGTSDCISVQQLPEGYSMADICYKSDDDKIATIDKQGVVTGAAGGSTLITIYTKDNRFKAYCAVTVIEDSTVTFTPLKQTEESGNLINL